MTKCRVHPLFADTLRLVSSFDRQRVPPTWQALQNAVLFILPSSRTPFDRPSFAFVFRTTTTGAPHDHAPAVATLCVTRTSDRRAAFWPSRGERPREALCHRWSAWWRPWCQWLLEKVLRPSSPILPSEDLCGSTQKILEPSVLEEGVLRGSSTW